MSGEKPQFRRRHSSVWTHFDEGDAKQARCLHCGLGVARSGNTSNLMSHLRRRHKDLDLTLVFDEGDEQGSSFNEEGAAGEAGSDARAPPAVVVRDVTGGEEVLTLDPEAAAAALKRSLPPPRKEVKPEVKRRKHTPRQDVTSIMRCVLDVACGAAREAGGLIKQSAGKVGIEKTKSCPQDFMTKMDTKCQEVIRSYVNRHFPGHVMLGEEEVPPGSAASKVALRTSLERSDWVWIVDPIDGTTNFVHGIPNSTVSIGVVREGVPEVGVIYDPYRDELFTAIRGQGAFMNGHRIKVSEDALLGQAVVAWGTAHAPSVSVPMMRGVTALITGPRPVRALRSLGSACLELAWVAAGRFTAFYQLDLHSWDLAAGCLLVSEAGGLVSEASGGPYSIYVRDVVATNGQQFHGDLIDVLRGAGGAATLETPAEAPVAPVAFPPPEFSV